jgi:hypothetical protein
MYGVRYQMLRWSGYKEDMTSHIKLQNIFSCQLTEPQLSYEMRTYNQYSFSKVRYLLQQNALKKY